VLQTQGAIHLGRPLNRAWQIRSDSRTHCAEVLHAIREDEQKQKSQRSAKCSSPVAVRALPLSPAGLRFLESRFPVAVHSVRRADTHFECHRCCCHFKPPPERTSTPRLGICNSNILWSSISSAIRRQRAACCSTCSTVAIKSRSCSRCTFHYLSFGSTTEPVKTDLESQPFGPASPPDVSEDFRLS